VASGLTDVRFELKRQLPQRKSLMANGRLDGLATYRELMFSKEGDLPAIPIDQEEKQGNLADLAIDRQRQKRAWRDLLVSSLGSAHFKPLTGRKWTCSSHSRTIGCEELTRAPP
jgi:hypothetical protein